MHISPITSCRKMSSKEHFETLKAYKQMDRMDAYAAKTGGKPAYEKSGGIVDMGWAPPQQQSQSQQQGGNGTGGKK